MAPSPIEVFETLESGAEAWEQSQQETFTRQLQSLLERLRNIQELSQLQPALSQVQQSLDQGKYHSVRRFVDDLGKQLLSHADPKKVYLRDAMTTAVVTGCQHLVTARSELELASVARLHCRLLQLRHNAEIVRQADAENKVGSKTPEERANGGWEHPVAQPDEHDSGGNAGGAESSEDGGSDVAPDDSPSREKRKTSDETGSPRRKQKVAEHDEDEHSRERDVPARASKGRAKAAAASPTKARGNRSSRR